MPSFALLRDFPGFRGFSLFVFLLVVPPSWHFKKALKEIPKTLKGPGQSSPKLSQRDSQVSLWFASPNDGGIFHPSSFIRLQTFVSIFCSSHFWPRSFPIGFSFVRDVPLSLAVLRASDLPSLSIIFLFACLLICLFACLLVCLGFALVIASSRGKGHETPLGRHILLVAHSCFRSGSQDHSIQEPTACCISRHANPEYREVHICKILENIM